MTLLSDFARVSRRHPCPVCGRGDWCLASRDEPANPPRVVCARVDSGWRFGEAGWLHVLRGGYRPSRPRTRVITARPQRADLETLAREFQGLVELDLLHDFAQGLGLPTDCFSRLGIGFIPEDRLSDVGIRWARHGWSFPMEDHRGEIIGLRLRLPSGKKLAVTGSRQGLLVPSGVREEPERLLVAEGESDTAALLALGFNVIGRPGCTAAVKLVTRFVRDLRPTSVVVVADTDEVGRCGAFDLATRVRLVCGSVRVVLPPSRFKDAREWVCAGATVGDVQRTIERAKAVGIRTVAEKDRL